MTWEGDRTAATGQTMRAAHGPPSAAAPGFSCGSPALGVESPSTMTPAAGVSSENAASGLPWCMAWEDRGLTPQFHVTMLPTTAWRPSGGAQRIPAANAATRDTTTHTAATMRARVARPAAFRRDRPEPSRDSSTGSVRDCTNRSCDDEPSAYGPCISGSCVRDTEAARTRAGKLRACPESATAAPDCVGSVPWYGEVPANASVGCSAFCRHAWSCRAWSCRVMAPMLAHQRLPPTGFRPMWTAVGHMRHNVRKFSTITDFSQQIPRFNPGPHLLKQQRDTPRLQSDERRILFTSCERLQDSSQTFPHSSVGRASDC